MPDRNWFFRPLPVICPDLHLELRLPEPDKLISVLLRDERLQPVCELPIPDPDPGHKQLRLLNQLRRRLVQEHYLLRFHLPGIGPVC